MSEWGSWIGQEERRTDRLDPSLAARWCATLDLPPHHAGAMPQGIHFALCTPDAPTHRLGEDGHPARDESENSFLPPIPLPRRMWASSTIRFHAPIMVDATVERVSRIVEITEKSGRSGDMVFVNVAHETNADGALAVSETQTLVYREAADKDASLSPDHATDGVFHAQAWDMHSVLVPDPRLLFRYSALTFNTHRIHYDAPYAREVERYRGLVVHGPLMASLLLMLAQSELGENALGGFDFRALSPAIAGDALHLAMREDGNRYELGTFASDGRQVVAARATVA